MYRFILAATLALASSAGLAFEITCDKPEYLQLKTASKAELQQEFCRTTRTHALNMDMHKISEETVSKLRATGADSSDSAARSQESLKAATSCRRAAAEYAGAIERRFKIQPPAAKACLSPGGI